MTGIHFPQRALGTTMATHEHKSLRRPMCRSIEATARDPLLASSEPENCVFE